jgi:hypothetical protein
MILNIFNSIIFMLTRLDNLNLQLNEKGRFVLEDHIDIILGFLKEHVSQEDVVNLYYVGNHLAKRFQVDKPEMRADLYRAVDSHCEDYGMKSVSVKEALKKVYGTFNRTVGGKNITKTKLLYIKEEALRRYIQEKTTIREITEVDVSGLVRG